jgi:hypothetical protein
MVIPVVIMTGKLLFLEIYYNYLIACSVCDVSNAPHCFSTPREFLEGMDPEDIQESRVCLVSL